ncbi:hypothetical protein MCEMIEM13_00220 [Comamonadaceae bacterium]
MFSKKSNVTVKITPYGRWDASQQAGRRPLPLL